MHKFIDWLTAKENKQMESFGGDGQGQWQPNLETPSNYYVISFNAPDQSNYELITHNTMPVSLVINKDGRYYDSGYKLPDVIESNILKALNEFIRTKNPEGLKWGHITKSLMNPVTKQYDPNERENIFESWAKTWLFPKSYVPLKPTHWIRRDIYDSKYVPQGYPPVPQDSHSAPGILYNKMIKQLEPEQLYAYQRKNDPLLPSKSLVGTQQRQPSQQRQTKSNSSWPIW